MGDVAVVSLGGSRREENQRGKDDGWVVVEVAWRGLSVVRRLCGRVTNLPVFGAWAELSGCELPWTRVNIYTSKL